MTSPVDEPREEEQSKVGGRITARLNDIDFQRLFNVVPLGILVLSPDFTIRYVNGRLIELLGFPKAEMEGHPLRMLLLDDSMYKLIADSIESARSESGVVSRELTCGKKDGSLLETLLRLTLAESSNPRSDVILAFLHSWIRRTAIAQRWR